MCNTRNARDHARQGCWRSLVLRTAQRCSQRPFVQSSPEKVLILFPRFQFYHFAWEHRTGEGLGTFPSSGLCHCLALAVDSSSPSPILWSFTEGCKLLAPKP